MDLFPLIFTVIGLSFFEIVSGIDNAIINAEALSTMGQRARRWFLLYGIFIAVFLVRGFLPLLIMWGSAPSLGIIGAFTATFSGDLHIKEVIEQASPILLAGGGIFLIFLFFHWLFLETKHFGLRGEKFFYTNGVWFFAVVSVILSVVVWFSLKQNSMMAFGAVVGSTAFFIAHGFKQNAEQSEKKLMREGMSDMSKVLYLEVIDATFSVDGVLGAFAFTLSVPLILIGNGIGAFVVRQITVGNIERVKKYVYLKNGAMYSILLLGLVMLLDSFGFHIPPYISPIITFGVVGYFFSKSHFYLKNTGS